VLGRDVRARLVYLGHDPVDVEAVAIDHARIDVTVTAMDAALASGGFEPRPGQACAGCPHRTVCAHAV
jgi:TPP-dependent indolepyruvate ferredoxin oxidoreductase alpha subunit